MTRRQFHALSGPDASPEIAGTGVQAFRLGDYGVLDLSAPLAVRSVQRALLWEWSTSPAGVIVRVSPDEPPDDGTLGAVANLAAALVRMWPGTPMSLISESSYVRDLVTHHPSADHLVIASCLTEVWDGLWSRGGKANVVVELPPTGQAPRTARDVVVRACLDWHLDGLATPAARLTDELVSRSVSDGARDLHLTVSRHESRIRVLARDDVPSTAHDEVRTIHRVFGALLPAGAPVDLDDSTGEFAFDGHHVRWAVMDAHAA